MNAAHAKLYRLGGEGPPLLFIHGFGSDRYSWAANAPQFSDVATVWAVDLPGHGEAGNHIGDGSLADLAHAVADQIGQIGAPVVIVGHSLGGAVAIALTKIVPNVVKHLVLLSPAGLGVQLDHDFLAGFPALQTEEQARPLLEKLVTAKRLIAPAMIAHVLRGLQSGERRSALTKIAAALAEMPLQSLPEETPVDLIWGEADMINPSPDFVPSARSFLRLPDIGHMPQVEAASRVNAVIRAALTTA